MENNEILNLDKIINYIKDKKKLIIIFMVIILTPLLLLIITKMSPSSKSIRQLNKFSKESKSINDTLKSAIESEGINTEIAKNNLSVAIVNLNNIKIPLEAIEVPEDVNAAKEQLIKTVDLNISVCEQNLSMYMNPSNDKLQDKLNKYKATLQEFKENNSSLSEFRIDSLISEDAELFFDKTNSYFNTMIKINIMKDINKEKNSDYLLAVNQISNKFNEIKEDLKPALEDIKANNRSLYILIEDLENKKLIFENIKNDFYTLSIPEDVTEIHNSLEETIKNYQSYATSFESNLYKDFKENNKLNISEYDSAFSEYTKFINSLETLNNNLDLFKRN